MSSPLIALAPFYLPYPGGAEKSLHEMLRRLVLLGWPVEALIPLAPFPAAPPERESVTVMDGVIVRRMPVEQWFLEVERMAPCSPAILFSLAHLFRAQFDARLDRLLKTYRGKTVYFCRGADPRDYFPAALVVANSQAVLKTLPEHRGVRNTILTPMIAAPCPKPGIPRKYVTLVNPTARKGGDVFVELARRMPHTPFLAQLGRSAPVADLTSVPNITVRPPAPDLDDLYSETKVLLMPSLTEPFGRVAIEGALGGCLLLLHRTDGLKEVPVPAFCFVDNLDPGVWERRLSILLEASENQQALWVEAIRQAASNYHPGWESLLAELRSLIAQRTPAAAEGAQGIPERSEVGDVEELFTQYLPIQMKVQTQLLKELKCSCRIVLSGPHAKSWILHFDGAQSRVVAGDGPASCELDIGEADLSAIIQGTTTIEHLMNIPGRISVRGERMAAYAFMRLMY
jgi:hypothetical protein